MTRHTIPLIALSLAVASFLFSAPLSAGPALLCRPVEAGRALTLPWNGDPGGFRNAHYQGSNLVTETLSCLRPRTPVLARMETLRRATLYAAGEPQAAGELIARLLARALDGEARGRPDARAWFDAGYAIECAKQLPLLARSPLSLEGIDGYSWVIKALDLAGGDPEIEFAAALVASDGRREASLGHLGKAVAAAEEGSLLARNLVTRFGRQGASSLAELRSSIASGLP